MPFLSYSYNYKIVYLKNEQKERFLFADYHEALINSKNNSNTQQRKDFVEIAKQLNAAVIVEDSYIYNNDELMENFAQYNNDDYTCLLFNIIYLNSNESMLYGLSALCFHSDIPVTNVEFRFCFSAKANIQKLYDLYNRVRKEIEGYQENHILTEIYSQELALCHQDFNKAMNALTQFLDNPPVQTLFSKVMTTINLMPNKLHELLIEVAIALNPLIDLKILHVLENEYKDHKTVFVAAGGLHIHNLEKHLMKLGYTVDQRYGNADFWLFEPDAINIQESFKQFGIETEQQNISLVTGILALKNFFEQKKLHYIFDTSLFFHSLASVARIKVKPQNSKNPLSFLYWFILPSPAFAFDSFIDYLRGRSFKRKQK